MVKLKNAIVLTILILIFGVSTVTASVVRTPVLDTYCDGLKCTRSIHSNIVNYFDGNAYVPIVTTITSSSDPLYDYEVTTGMYHTFFKEDPTAGLAVKVVSDSNTLEFQPMTQLLYRNALSQQAQLGSNLDSTGAPSSNDFIYEDAYGSGLDLTYSYQNTYLKENLVIASLSDIPAPPQYILDGGDVTVDLEFNMVSDSKFYIDGVEWDKNSDKTTQSAVTLKDDSDNIIYTLPQPYAIDSNTTPSKQLLTYHFKESGKKLYVTISTPYDWINDPDRVFPIQIDPSVQLSTGDVAEDVFARDSINDSYGVFTKINISSLSGSLNIESAQYCVYWADHHYSAPDNDVRIRRFANQTWNDSVSDYWVTEFLVNETTHSMSTNWTNISIGQYGCANYTRLFDVDYQAGNTYSSIILDDPDRGIVKGLSGVGDTAIFIVYTYIYGLVGEDSENSQGTGYTPYVNVSYTLENSDVTLEGPTDNFEFFYKDRPFEFNFTPYSNFTLHNASVYGNWTGTWHLNQTNTTTVTNASLYNFTGINVSRKDNIAWNVEVCGSNAGTILCNFATSNYTLNVSNTAPTMTDAELNLTAGVTNDMDLFCNITGETDLDGDSITKYYEWYNDTKAMDIDVSVLKNGNLTTGDDWYCEGWVGDGYENSSKYTSTIITVGSSNVAPSIDNYNATTAATNVNSTSSNPTNNNSYINFSVQFTDANTENWTGYFCSSPTWSTCLANASGELYCTSEVNSSLKSLSCLYNTTGQGLGGSYTYYSYALDNASLVSSGQSNSFEINRPPTVPSITTPADASYLAVNYTTLTYSSTDADSDGINYTIYNSTDGSSYGILTTNTTYYWDNLSDNTYYLIAYSTDHHDYSLYENNTVTTFIIDTTEPTYNRHYVSSSSPTTSVSVTFYANVTDTNVGAATSCKYTLKKSDYNGGNGVGAAWNETTTTKSGDLFSFSLSMSAIGTGTLEWTSSYCTDLAGNIATNETVNTNITISAPVSPPGGGGSTTITEEIDLTQAVETGIQAASICGNGICQEGENPINCPQDCSFNVDELFCFFGDKECPAWVFNVIIYIIVGVILYVTYIKQTGRKFK